MKLSPLFSRILLAPVLFFVACESGGGVDVQAPADARLVSDSLPWCHPGPPCPQGWFAYTDKICDTYRSSCSHRGDDLCYQVCKTNSDCTDPRFPFCSSLIFYGGWDFSHDEPACRGPELPRCDTIFDAGR